MQFHEAQARHAAAHPFIVERWSARTERWTFLGEHPSRESAERAVAMQRTLPAYAESEFRIVVRDGAQG